MAKSKIRINSILTNHHIQQLRNKFDKKPAWFLFKTDEGYPVSNYYRYFIHAIWAIILKTLSRSIYAQK